MDEARRVIRRLERIEQLQRADAPSATLLAEVRQLLHEGEAWLAVERTGAGGGGRRVVGAREVGGRNGREPTTRAAAALAGCRETLGRGEGVTPGSAETTSL